MSEKTKGFLRSIFGPKDVACCGVKLEEHPPAEAGSDRVAGDLAVRSTANAFLIRRVEALRSMRGNPYEAHFKNIGPVMGVVVGRAATPALNRVFDAGFDDFPVIREFNSWFSGFRALPTYQVERPVDGEPASPPGFARLPGWNHVVLEKDIGKDDPMQGESDGSITVEQISKDESELFMRIYAEAFDYPSAVVQPLCRSIEILMGQPEMLSYLARVSGEPVSVGQLFLGPHGVGYLGSTGTLPAARRMGCQAILDRRRIADARRARCDKVCRQVAVDSQSWRNALKIGFRTVYREEVYAPAAMLPRSMTEPQRAAAAAGESCCAAQPEQPRHASAQARGDGCCSEQLPAGRT